MTFSTLARSEIADAYRQAAIENAPPVVVVRHLFEGALNFIDRATSCDPKQRGSRFSEHVRRADAIVVELRLALDREAHPELVGRLEQLYLFVEACFRRAQRERDHAPLAEARSVLAILFDGWSRIDLGSARPG